MIIFTARHARQVLDGSKTFTRRYGKKRWNVLAVHQCKTSRFGPKFADVLICDVYKQRLGDMTNADAQLEGAADLAVFQEVWLELHGTWRPDDIVWVVQFCLHTDPLLRPRED
jgi:hypothetical protein